MTSDGTPWRPLVHVEDICEAVVEVLEAPRDAVHGEILNVGHDEQNYRIREIAEIVGWEFRGCELSFGAPNGDNRSYRVSFAKIRKHLPGFVCRRRAEDGARQLHQIFERIGMTAETFAARSFTRLAQLRYLCETRQLDAEFRWRPLISVAA